MELHYLEIVTAEVEATCAALGKSLGVSFSDPVAELGGARTAAMESGAEVGIRAPMNDGEDSVVRPYHRVDDLEQALAAAVEAGGEVALPSMEIPGRGQIAIYILGGIQHGLWKV